MVPRQDFLLREASKISFSFALLRELSLALGAPIRHKNKHPTEKSMTEMVAGIVTILSTVWCRLRVRGRNGVGT